MRDDAKGFVTTMKTCGEVLVELLELYGIDTVFGPLASRYELRIEYLDAIHNPGLLKGPLLLELLRTKLSKQVF